jgi:hypothetical protein
MARVFGNFIHYGVPSIGKVEEGTHDEEELKLKPLRSFTEAGNDYPVVDGEDNKNVEDVNVVDFVMFGSSTRFTDDVNQASDKQEEKCRKHNGSTVSFCDDHYHTRGVRTLWFNNNIDTDPQDLPGYHSGLVGA